MKKIENEIFESIRLGEDLNKYPKYLVSRVLEFQRSIKEFEEPDPILVRDVMNHITALNKPKVSFFSEVFSWSPQLAGLMASVALLSFQTYSSETPSQNSLSYFGTLEESPLFGKEQPGYGALLNLNFEDKK